MLDTADDLKSSSGSDEGGTSENENVHVCWRHRQLWMLGPIEGQLTHSGLILGVNEALSMQLASV